MNLGNKITKGTRLTEGQLNEFLVAAAAAVNARLDGGNRAIERTASHLANTGIDPERWLSASRFEHVGVEAPQPKLAPEQEAAIPVLSNAEAQKQVDTTGRPLLYRDANGNPLVAEPSKER